MENLSKRILFCLLGLFVSAFGVAFITKSALGTSQVASVPYVFSLYISKLSFGGATFIVNMIFVLIEFIILKSRFKTIHFLQIFANVLFSTFIDLGMYLLSWFNPMLLVLRVISLVIGCFILATGISIQVASDVLFVPGEGLVRVISSELNKEFGVIKVYFDLALITISCSCSLIFFNELRGIGFGTILSAVIIGKLVLIVDHSFPLIWHIKKLKIN